MFKIPHLWDHSSRVFFLRLKSLKFFILCYFNLSQIDYKNILKAIRLYNIILFCGKNFYSCLLILFCLTKLKKGLYRIFRSKCAFVCFFIQSLHTFSKNGCTKNLIVQQWPQIAKINNNNLVYIRLLLEEFIGFANRIWLLFVRSQLWYPKCGLCV